MRDIDTDSITAAVIASFGGASDERLKLLVSRLVACLHEYAREVELTHDEWRAAIAFLSEAGRISNEGRNEFVLTSDVLGLSSLVDMINTRSGATNASALGPFHARGSPRLGYGADLIGANAGEPVLVCGRVLDASGAPLAGAVLDFWQAADNGLYWQQDSTQHEHNLRGRFVSRNDGTYAFTTIRPAPYTVPYDGPVGGLLRAGGRHAWRPAHFHFIVSAPGHAPVTTELFFEGDPYLDEDAVFGVREPLIVPLAKSGTAAQSLGLARALTSPYYRVEFDFHLIQRD